jgi:hypothetical protein
LPPSAKRGKVARFLIASGFVLLAAAAVLTAPISNMLKKGQAQEKTGVASVPTIVVIQESAKSRRDTPPAELPDGRFYPL